MVSAYIPYQEIAVSTQTDRPRMIFEENSGLGVVVPHDAITETIKAAVGKINKDQTIGTRRGSHKPIPYAPLPPEPVSVPGTKPNNRCGLIGMVSAYLPYREIAISTQTDRPRKIFEENSGLGVVVPHDLIPETVKAAVDKLGQPEPTTDTE